MFRSTLTLPVLLFGETLVVKLARRRLGINDIVVGRGPRRAVRAEMPRITALRFAPFHRNVPQRLDDVTVTGEHRPVKSAPAGDRRGGWGGARQRSTPRLQWSRRQDGGGRGNTSSSQVKGGNGGLPRFRVRAAQGSNSEPVNHHAAHKDDSGRWRFDASAAVSFGGETEVHAQVGVEHRPFFFVHVLGHDHECRSAPVLDGQGETLVALRYLGLDRRSAGARVRCSRLAGSRGVSARTLSRRAVIPPDPAGGR